MGSTFFFGQKCTMRTRRTERCAYASIVFTLVISISGCGEPDGRKATSEGGITAGVAREPSEESTALPASELSSIQNLISSEELILELTNELGLLNRSARNLRLPFGSANKLFQSDFQVADLVKIEETTQPASYIAIDHWLVGESASADEGIWREFFAQVDFLETAKFYFVGGDIDVAARLFESKMGFVAHAQMNDGSTGYVRSTMDVDWQLSGRKQDRAKIVEFKTKQFWCTRSGKQMFEDVSQKVIRDEKLANELARSAHEEILEKLLAGKPVKPPAEDRYRMFFTEVNLEHPSVAVVDIDRDGLDDFFVARFNLPSLMFRNCGDGSFEEIGTRVGLRFSHDCTSAMFADFDNDGDSDAFIGRSRNRAVFMENKAGVFFENKDAMEGFELPYMVSSMASADYDNDGLLDIYFSTYSPIEGSHEDVMKGEVWPKHFFDREQYFDFKRRRSQSHPYLDMVGPPNMLLRNTGGRFEKTKNDLDVNCWRMSFQSNWCDFDQDGDQDLYVCNDFAKDELYQNNGDSTFTAITESIGLKAFGFGMGSSWNDHNNDGHFDLYVSNMYSKAGSRITARIDGIDPRFTEMAKGNFLYQFDGTQFQLVSVNGPQDAVAKTGWSWGGQMTDIDNDTFVDIVVANGYYSAPADVAMNVDL